MTNRKTDCANLRQHYPIYLQVGLVATLLVLILAFRANVQSEADFIVIAHEQERIHLEDIVQTRREFTPPPPPRPPAPAVVPDDTILDEDPIDWDMSLTFDDGLEARQPPALVEEEDLSDEIFIIVEEQPTLIGGLAALQRAVQYPEFARRAGIEGTVFVQFVVDENGNVVDPQITRGVHRLLDEAALEAVTQVQFEPGRQRGQEVNVSMSLPVRFQLG